MKETAEEHQHRIYNEAIRRNTVYTKVHTPLIGEKLASYVPFQSTEWAGNTPTYKAEDLTLPSRLIGECHVIEPPDRFSMPQAKDAVRDSISSTSPDHTPSKRERRKHLVRVR